MNNMQNKIFKVFNSCKTEQHIDVAIKYANLQIKQLPKGRENTVYNIVHVRLIERIIGYTQGRLNVDL